MWARRPAALAEVQGSNHLTSIFAELLDRSEAMTRAALSEIPPGTYRYVDHLDNMASTRPARPHRGRRTVADGAMEVDFTGSSGQVRGP